MYVKRKVSAIIRTWFKLQLYACIKHLMLTATSNWIAFNIKAKSLQFSQLVTIYISYCILKTENQILFQDSLQPLFISPNSLNICLKYKRVAETSQNFTCHFLHFFNCFVGIITSVYYKVRSFRTFHMKNFVVQHFIAFSNTGYARSCCILNIYKYLICYNCHHI